MTEAKLPTTFDPPALETRLYKMWCDGDAFKPSASGVPFTIVMPPPNVTGNLHIGHALNATIQDILCRYHRMCGRSVLWLPGTDHAGIATQMVVERQLALEGNVGRHEMGREAFVERVWQWKETSGQNISNQFKRLGASCDWSRARFTMDDDFSQIVAEVFVSLCRSGLIYRGKRLVNWDPYLGTAISDLEVVPREVKGKMWHFNYPLADGSGAITIATTRPETMLGDSAVAVHPDDVRYRELIGRDVVLPLVGRMIPIIADAYVDPKQGSGAVKITPAHDFNDFEVGIRHDLRLINIFDSAAQVDLSDSVFADMPSRESWQGLSRDVARGRVIAECDTLGLLVDTVAHCHVVPYGDRSDVVIEPWLTEQWYLDAPALAGGALAAVRSGEMRFSPENWAKIYFEWLEGIQPWCISRQLWWGHRIPVWYTADGRYYAALNEVEARAHFGDDVVLTQDEDVLDTWFSSGLWPLVTLGWVPDPDRADSYDHADLAMFTTRYPTDVLVTGFDIIFFWVARMMMFGLHLAAEETTSGSCVPFREVKIHGLVRDADGSKMSKSRGNVLDPLEMADKYGADALRFALVTAAGEGRDVKLSEDRVRGYRNFATKLWNAARFCELNGCFAAPLIEVPANDLTAWIFKRLYAREYDLERGHFHHVAENIYHFVWDDFCDWHIEFIKPILQNSEHLNYSTVQSATKTALLYALEILHPFMPFVTEEIYQKMCAQDSALKAQGAMLITRLSVRPPATAATFICPATTLQLKIIRFVRQIKERLGIVASQKIGCRLIVSDRALYQQIFAANDADSIYFIETIARLARLDLSPLGEDKSAEDRLADWIRFTLPSPDNDDYPTPLSISIALDIKGAINIDQCMARISAVLARHRAEADKIVRKLADQQFRKHAPANVITENELRIHAAEVAIDDYQKILIAFSDMR